MSQKAVTFIVTSVIILNLAGKLWFLTILRDFCALRDWLMVFQLFSWSSVYWYAVLLKSLFIFVFRQSWMKHSLIFSRPFNIFVCITQQKYNLTMFLASDSVFVMFVNLDHLSYTYVCKCITVFKLFAWKYPYWNIYCLFWGTVTEYFLFPVTFLTSISLPDLTDYGTDSLLRGW